MFVCDVVLAADEHAARPFPSFRVLIVASWNLDEHVRSRIHACRPLSHNVIQSEIELIVCQELERESKWIVISRDWRK